MNPSLTIGAKHLTAAIEDQIAREFVDEDYYVGGAALSGVHLQKGIQYDDCDYDSDRPAGASADFDRFFHQHDVQVEIVIKSQNPGALLVEYQDNYYWVPKSIVKEGWIVPNSNGELNGTVYIYRRIWNSILDRTPPNNKNQYELYV